MINSVITVLLLLILFLGTFAGSFMQALIYDEYFISNKFKVAFGFAEEIWNTTKDELNLAGRIICVIVIQLFILPGSIILIITVFLYKIIELLWSIFKYVFKKK